MYQIIEILARAIDSDSDIVGFSRCENRCLEIGMTRRSKRLANIRLPLIDRNVKICMST